MSVVAAAKKKRRVFVYVDGFNLYHRCLEHKHPHKWLCLRKLAMVHLFPGDEIVSIKYFTAKVDPGSEGSQKQKRQMVYWNALRSQGVEIIEGLMEKRERICKAQHICDKGGSYSQYTEKMSDVNLALHVYRDFIDEIPDIICVLSADLDVLPALKMIRETGKKINRKVMIKVILPSQDEGLYYSRIQDFKQVAITTQLSETFIKNSRLDDVIQFADGEIKCPELWKSAPPAVFSGNGTED